MFYRPDEASVRRLDFGTKWKLRSMKDFYSKPPVPLSISPPIYDIFEKSRYRTLEVQDPKGGLVTKRQRTEWWHGARNGILTGSKLANAAGLFGLDGMIETWRNTYLHADPPVEEEKAEAKKQECMAWGTYHETDAVATFLHQFGEPYDLVSEECILTPVREHSELRSMIRRIWTEDFGQQWTPEWERLWYYEFLKTSPDLRGFSLLTGKRFVLEIKCKYGLRSPALYAQAPYYYYLQTQVHMLAEGLTSCFLLAWSPKGSKMWNIKQDLTCWATVLPLLMRFHWDGIRKKEPTALYDERRTQKVKELCSQPATLIGAFPSQHALEREDTIQLLEQQVSDLTNLTSLSRNLAKKIVLYDRTPERQIIVKQNSSTET